MVQLQGRLYAAPHDLPHAYCRYYTDILDLIRNDEAGIVRQQGKIRKFAGLNAAPFPLAEHHARGIDGIGLHGFQRANALFQTKTAAAFSLSIHGGMDGTHRHLRKDRRVGME